MKYRLITLFLTLLLGVTVHAEPVNLSDELLEPIGEYASFLKEGDAHLELDEVIEAYNAGKFSTSTSPVLSFSIVSKPVWIRFDINNPGNTPISKRLSIETSWLDKVDVYFLKGTHQLKHYQLGDSLPFSARPVDNLFFVLDHQYESGLSTIYLRVETPDPTLVPIYLRSTEAMHAAELNERYTYGITYGAILALLLYNLMLYVGLKNRRYLYYVLYLGMFLLMNLSYTGQGFKYFWPDFPALQLWIIPGLMVAYAISGLMFATSFLETKTSLPRMHRMIIRGCWGFAIAYLISLIAQQASMTILIAFAAVLPYTIAMILLGVLALRAGNPSARYFLYAIVIAAIGASITGLAVSGFIPYHNYTYRAVEYGTVIEAILLALALADRFRLTQAEKASAEQMARIDSLTGLNNRRAFSELVEPMWQTGVRKKHDMAIIMLDIDVFKSINDSFGHAEGDKVLIHTARVLAQSARAGDILARWGGEEFVLFMTETSLQDAVTIAERIRESISSSSLSHEDHALSFTVSLGVDSYSKETLSLEELIDSADEYLYKAKKAGRDQVCSPLSN